MSINAETLGGLDEETIQDLVGNAAGIEVDDRDDKITVAYAPFYVPEDTQDGSSTETIAVFVRNNLPLIVVGVAVLLALLILILVLRRRAKKRKAEEEKFLAEAAQVPDEPVVAEETEPIANPEIINMQNERSRELREMVRQFTEDNPELSAQMIKTWLHGGDEGGN